MNVIFRSVLFLFVFFLLCDSAYSFKLFGKSGDDESEGFSIEKFFEKNDEMIKERVSGSQITKPKKGNFALFKDAKFHLRGDYQINAVQYNERDLNGINGNDYYWDGSPYENDDQNWYRRSQTNEIEAWIYHDLTLKPSIEFNGGLVNFHAELYNGGYMWETAFPDVVETQRVFVAGNFEQSTMDYQKIKLQSAFIELVTPLGMILAGQLPKDFLGLHGFVYGMGLPSLPQWNFALAYGKIAEGYNKYASEHEWGIDFWDTQNDHDYQDKDDLTMYGLMAMYDNSETLTGQIVLGKLLGGSGAWAWSNTNITAIAGTFEYNKNNFHLTTILQSRFGDGSPLTSNEEGKAIKRVYTLMNNTIANVLGLENARPTQVFPKDIVIDPGVAFFSLASYDMGKYTPELGLMYITGGDRWYKGSQQLSRSFEPEGNRTPRPYLKAYLLNEIEDKYFPLISTFATAGSPGETEASSYQNMTSIKVGTEYRINKYFKLFSQVLAAWRTDVAYYEEDYWDMFFLTYGKPFAYYETNDDFTKQRVGATVIQRRNVDYHQDIDPFLGIECNGKLTWLVRPGVELSFIGAFFKPGQFYEDILTPKEYYLQWSVLVDGASASQPYPGKQLEYIYGPNFSVPHEGEDGFKMANAWTAQLKLDFKFQ